MKKYRIVAKNCVEYDLNNGWEYAYSILEESDLFDTEKEMKSFAPTFIKELNILENEVVCIELQTLEVEIDESDCEEDGEQNIKYSNIDIIDFDSDIIDNSDRIDSTYIVLSEYFGQYMLPQGKYKLDTPYRGINTKNELFLRTENSPFHYHPIEVFETEEAAKEYVIENGLHVVESCVDLGDE